MTTVVARKLPPAQTAPDTTSTLVTDARPSWRSSFSQRLYSFSTPLGVTTQWLVGTTLRKSLTTPLDHGLPIAVCLASIARWKEVVESSLCVALPDSLHLYTPSEQVLEIPLPSNASPLSRLSGLFPLYRALLLELSTGTGTDLRRRYFVLMHPLEEPLPLMELDDKDRIIFSSTDVPLLVTRNNRYIKVWSALEAAPEVTPVSGAQSKSKTRSGKMSGTLMPSPALCPFRSVLQLRLVHIQTEDVHRGAGASAFLAHDMRGRLVLCLVASGCLTVLSFGFLGGVADNVSVAYRIDDVVHAVPVLACRRGNGALDTLVQHAGGDMSLYVGPHRVCEVTLSPRQKRNDGGAKAAQRKKRMLKSESFDVFKVRFGNGSAGRYTLQGIAFRAQLINKCMAAISCSFDETDCLSQMVLLFQKVVAELQSESVDSDGNFEREWDLFLDVLLQDPGKLKGAKDVELKSEGAEVAELSDWEFLTERTENSTQGALHMLPTMWPGEKRVGVSKVDTGTLSGEQKLILMRVLNALHLLYENKKLNTLLGKEVAQLAKANRRIALHIGSTSYLDYYRRELGSVGDMTIENQILRSGDSHLLELPSIFDHLVGIMKGDQKEEFPDLGFSKRERNQSSYLLASGDADSPTTLARCIEHYYRCLYSDKNDAKSRQERAEMVLTAMVKNGFGRQDVEALPFGVALPLQDALWVCRKTPKRNWSPEAFFLIEREDLLPFSLDGGAPKSKSLTSGRDETAASLSLLRMEAVSAADSNSLHLARDENETVAHSSAESSAAEAEDGCDMGDAIFALRFGQDRRLEEVRRMLRSTKPIVISPVAEPGSIGEPDTKEFQAKLAVLLRKRLASPVGRGAFTLRTFLPADPTKPLVVPNICMTGHLCGQKYAKINLTEATPIAVAWGEFHNGVASGLRLVAPNSSSDSDNVQVLTRSWIVRHKPTDNSASASHAGMLLALGLGGFLPALRTTDVYQYLLPRHDITSIGLMLGLASGNRGSMHNKITKMLCMHIRSFNDTAFAVPDFSVSVNVQTAAVFSLGLLYECSHKPYILEGLFLELTRCSRFGKEVDGREGLSLASGIAIGMVCLGLGEPLVSISKGNLVDRLARFANGEPEGLPDDIPVPEATGSPKSSEENSANDGVRAGLCDSDACRVVEMSSVNVDVVAPGALLALGLMYLKTNDEHVANRIRVPQNFYDLDRVRPDHVFLQILARSIILWDEISPTLAWVMECLPPFLRPPELDEAAEDFCLLANIGKDSYGRYIRPDVVGVLCARAFGIAGACTAMALRFAGSNDARVVSILKRACVSFENALGQVKEECEDAEYMYSTCLASCSLAVGVASAGSGDLDVFRLLRRLRKRAGPSLKSKRYGRYMAMDMAVGFLFLGGGCQTFGTSNSSIAALICSIFPKFPVDVMDNQYHLQALRHLYVLAVEPRCIETRDVDTDTPCQVDVEVVTMSNNVMKMTAPCIVPAADSVKHVSVVGERYWPTTVLLKSASEGRGWYSPTKRQIVYVKRRPGQLSHRADPKGSKGILAHSLCRTRPNSGKALSAEVADMEHLVRAFSADPEILAFARRFCAPRSGVAGEEKGCEPGAYDAWRRYSQVLCECLADDRAEALRSYFDAERAVASVVRGTASPSALGSVRVAMEYLAARRGADPALVAGADLGCILAQARGVVDADEVVDAVAAYVRSGGAIWPDGSVGVALGYAMRWYGVPQPKQLQALCSALRRRANDDVGESDMWLLCAYNLPPDCSEYALEYIAKALLRSGGRDGDGNK